MKRNTPSQMHTVTQTLSGPLDAGWVKIIPMDAYREQDRFLVRFDLPGVDPSAVELTVEHKVLTIRAQREWETGDGTEMLIAERPEGTFARQIALGEDLQTDEIKASYAQGVLTLVIPVGRVEVTAGGSGEGGGGGSARLERSREVGVDS